MLQNLDAELLCRVLAQVLDLLGVKALAKLAVVSTQTRDVIYSPAFWQGASLSGRDYDLAPPGSKLRWVIQTHLAGLSQACWWAGFPYLPSLRCLKVRDSSQPS